MSGASEYSIFPLKVSFHNEVRAVHSTKALIDSA